MAEDTSGTYAEAIMECAGCGVAKDVIDAGGDHALIDGERCPQIGEAFPEWKMIGHRCFIDGREVSAPEFRAAQREWSGVQVS